MVGQLQTSQKLTQNSQGYTYPECGNINWIYEGKIMNCRFSWGEGLKDRREKGFVVSNTTLTHAHTLRHFGRER